MGFVQIVDNLVDGKWEKGQLVAEELFADVERLIGLGAVQRVSDGTVEAAPAEAVAEAPVVETPVEAAPEPETAAEPKEKRASSSE